MASLAGGQVMFDVLFEFGNFEMMNNYGEAAADSMIPAWGARVLSTIFPPLPWAQAGYMLDASNAWILQVSLSRTRAGATC